MNYTELVAAAKSYSDRNDIDVANSIDTFITLAEARINRLLRTRKQAGRHYINTVSGQEYYCLPQDYSGIRDIQINKTVPGSESKSFRFAEPDIFNALRNEVYAGVPYYCIIANQLQVYPILDAGQTIEMVYYKKVTHLSSVNVQNWLSIDHPDIYLSGIIAEIELFVKNYEVSTLWVDRMSAAINELDSSDFEERWGGPSLEMRVG
jgi:hypothetical protein